MNDMTIQRFCDTHSFCDDGREWALANCVSMQDAWNTIKPDWLIWIATRPRVLTPQELRLFAVWSARQVQYLVNDPRSVQAIDTAERFANGNATKAELFAAQDAAWAAAQAASGTVAWAAAWAAARAASGTVAWAAAQAASGTVAWVAARDAARAAQADWLRKNTTPNFRESKL